MSCTRRRLKKEHLVVGTFFPLLSVSRTFDPHTHMRVAQDFTRVVLSLCALKKSSTHSMFHRPPLDMPYTFPSFYPTPPPSTSTALPMTGIRRPPCATPPGRLLFDHLAESTLHTSYEPKTCIDFSSDHTPINCSSRRNSSNIDLNDLTTTVAASENSDGFHQQAAASCSSQQASNEVNPWISPDMWPSTRKSVRNNESTSSAEGTFSRGKRDRDLESEQTLSERRNLHVYLEQKVQWRMRSSEEII